MGSSQELGPTLAPASRSLSRCLRAWKSCPSALSAAPAPSSSVSLQLEPGDSMRVTVGAGGGCLFAPHFPVLAAPETGLRRGCVWGVCYLRVTRRLLDS